MDLNYLAMLFRWLHILAAITAVGGTFFMLLALLPAAQTLGEADRARLFDATRQRWGTWVKASIGFLLISGIYNMLLAFGSKPQPAGLYHGLFGVKILIALAIFFIASVLVGRSGLAERFRSNARFWLSVNATLAVVLVCVSGVLKSVPRNPPGEPPAAVQPAEPSTSDAPSTNRVD